MKESLNRNAKDKVFKSLLKNKERLAQFYFDLTGRKVDPDEIEYDSIASSIIKGKEEDIAFKIGDRYIILLEAQSTWSDREVFRFFYYIILLFKRFLETSEENEVFKKQRNVSLPAIEAYVIYTGSKNLPEIISWDDFTLDDQKTISNIGMKIFTSENATGMVKEYIDFSQLETKYYTENKRSREDVIELINYCIANNMLKNYMAVEKNEVVTLIDNYFTEEKRIEDLIDNARNEEHKKFKAEIEKKDAEIKKKEESILAERTEMINLLSKNFKLSPEKIVDMTGYPLEMVNKVLNKK